MTQRDTKSSELEVNRSRFLLLTAAIAASACGGQQAAVGSPSGAGDFDTTASSSTGATGGEQEKPEPEEAATVEIPPPAPHQTEPGAVDEALPGGGPCSDDVGKPVSCRALRLPGPQCEQGMSINQRECEILGDVLRAGVAERVTRCLVQRSNDPNDDCALNDAVVDCPAEALDNMCHVDPSFERDCEPILTRCGRSRYSQITLESCQALLSAVKPSEQRTAISCMSEGCGTAHCILDLAYRRVY